MVLEDDQQTGSSDLAAQVENDADINDEAQIPAQDLAEVEKLRKLIADTFGLLPHHTQN